MKKRLKIISKVIFIIVLVFSLIFVDKLNLIQSTSAEDSISETEKEVTVDANQEKTVVKSNLNRATEGTSNYQKVSDVAIGKFTYNLKKDGTAEWRKITSKGFSGVLEIPSTVDYEGLTYQVTAINTPNVANAENVTDIVFPKSITTITGNLRNWNSIKGITIPKYVTAYNAYIWQCSHLENIIFEDGFENIGVGTNVGRTLASQCPALENVHFPSSLKNINCGYNSIITSCPIESIDFPEGVNIFDTSDMFMNCNQLKSVVLPESVTEIQDNAFKNCKALTSVTAKGTITYIGNSAFYGCEELVEVPDLSNITAFSRGEEFYNCKKLVNIQLNDQLAGLSYRTFGNCENLDMKVLNKVTKLYQESLINSGITEVDLSSSAATEIGKKVFSNCQKLEKVTIGGEITTISENAFAGCISLKEVYIGENITDIREGAFSNCAEDLVITIDNSEDNVDVIGNAFGNAKVIYLQKSIDNTLGDTIKENGMTLQEAIDALGNNGEGTIMIEKDIVLSSPVVIKGNRNVVLTSEQLCTIIGKKDTQSIERLFKIEKGSTLTLKGSLDLNGKYCSQNTDGNVVKVEGKFVIDDQVIIERSVMSNSSAISVTSEGSQFVMNNGTIKNCKIKGNSSAVIKVSNGGRFDMYGGEVCDNTVTSGMVIGSIYVSNNGTFHMHDGAIHDNILDKNLESYDNNVSYATAGVQLYGSSSGEDNVAIMIMDGGEIYNNEGIYGAGIAIFKNASVIMNDGTIYHNYAKNSGGAISVCDQYRIDNNFTGSVKEYSAMYKAQFTMNGGTIRDNTAKLNGGGIYVVSNDVTLNSGYITGNTATNRQGGGIYVSNEVTDNPGKEDSQYVLNISHALVTNNTAEIGGGVWICPTGFGEIHGTNGITIFGNEATKAADDLNFVNIGTGESIIVEGHHLTVDNHILGGGSVTWYRDGGSYTPSIINFLDSPDSRILRYPEQKDKIVDISDLQTGIGLKAIVSEEDQQLSKDAAKVVISGNTARSGGGIGSNGGVHFGEKDVYGSIELSKEISGISENELTNDGIFKFVVTSGSGNDLVYYDAEGNAHGEKVTIDVKLGEKVVISHLELGNYNISEDKDSAKIDGYELKVDGTGAVVVEEDKVVSIVVKNMYTKVDESNKPQIPEEPTPEKPTEPEEPKQPVVDGNVHLIIYKTDQDKKLLTGAAFELDKVIDGEEIFVDEKTNGPKFEFENLDDGVYRIYETMVPEGYEGLDIYFEIEIRNGKIYYNDVEELSFIVVNTNDGTTPYVLGEEVDNPGFEDFVLGDEVDTTKNNGSHKVVKTVKTFDNQNINIYIGTSFLSLVVIILVRKSLKQSIQ